MKKERLAWIDNLRITVIMLVVMVHSAVTYSGLGSWYDVENDSLDKISMVLFAFFQTFTQAWFMSMLFMVSGYFSGISLEKRGAKKFIGGRLKRLGIPLLVYVFLLQPLAVWLAYPDLDVMEWYLNGLAHFRFVSWTGPLWFVEALLIFTLIFVMVVKSGLTRRINLTFRATPARLLVLILITTALAFLTRLYFPIGSDLYNLQIGFFPAYVVMFTVGVLAYPSGTFRDMTLREGKRWLVVSLGLGIPGWSLIIFLGGPSEGIMSIQGGMNWPAFFYALWESFFCVTFIFALVGLYKHRVDASSRFQQFLSDNAFGVFVFHAPVLIGTSMALKGLEWPPLAKFALISLMAIAASFVVAWLVRRVGLFRKVFS